MYRKYRILCFKLVMILNGRLALIAEKVPECNVVCDIGSDHAYVPIYLVQRGKCRRAIATDIKEGPVAISKRNIEEYGLESYIDARVGDGLEPVNQNEIDVIIIAGMGGKLIAKILEEGIIKAKKARCLVLQPMNSEELVSKWLYENGFEIIDEGLAKEGNKIYDVKVAKWEPEPGENGNYSEIDIYISPKLISNNGPILPEYINKKINILNKKIRGLQMSKNTPHDELEKCIKLRNEMVEILHRVMA